MQLHTKTVGCVICAGLVLLLFLSKTIYAYTMPVVTGVKPTKGSLNNLEITSGVAGWAETEHIYAAVSGTVGRVSVREGDAVTKGQVLFEMNYDITSAKRKLTETRNSIEKLETDIQTAAKRLETIRTALSADASGSPADFSGYAGVIILELSKARSALNYARTAYELGFESRNAMLTAENNVKTLLLKYETEAEDLAVYVRSKELDRGNLLLAEEAGLEVLEKYESNAVITAPSDGVVTELPAEKGAYAEEHTLLASIGVGDAFTVTCLVSIENNFVSPGDACELSNASHILAGTVRRIKPSDKGKSVTVLIASGEAADGETFEVAFEKKSKTSFTLVPNAAINQDNDGYFLYQIKRRKGIMGEEYYLERLNIFIGDSDYQNTAVIRGITFFEPVVSASNKALSPGITVALKNPEDFFES